MRSRAEGSPGSNGVSDGSGAGAAVAPGVGVTAGWGSGTAHSSSSSSSADALQRALREEEAVTLYAQYAQLLGLGYAVAEQDEAVAPAYDGPLALQHARVPGGEGSETDDGTATPAPGPTS